MAWVETPPQLTGNNAKDLLRLRDYLFRMVGDLNAVAGTPGADGKDLTVSYRKDGKQIISGGGGIGGGSQQMSEIDRVRQQANQLRDLIIKTANGINEEIVNLTNGQTELSEEMQQVKEDAEAYADALINGENGVISYIEAKKEEYDSFYVASSEFGTFRENITSTIETTARGVVESYDYDSSISGLEGDLNELREYITNIDGEIRRGIVEDPSTGNYVTGIAISQKLEFSGVCGPTDSNNPGDGNTYYYLTAGQTFGLYTSTGWQFWIDGVKVGWFDSTDGMLHVGSVFVEQRIVHGGYWEAKTELINSKYMYVLNYIGD